MKPPPWLRQAWMRYRGLPPRAQGAIVQISTIAVLTIVAVMTAAADVISDLVPGGEPFDAVACGIVGFFGGRFCALLGGLVTEIAQARRDLDGDAAAMRSAIERLERGDR